MPATKEFRDKAESQIERETPTASMSSERLALSDCVKIKAKRFKQEKPLLRRIAKGLAVVASLGALIVAPSVMPKEDPEFTWNFTDSVPMGLYKRVDKRDVDPRLFRQEPTYVTFCLSGTLSQATFYERYCSPTGPSRPRILKRLVAEQTSGGWVVQGFTETSLDSRVFGPIETQQIQRFWRPLFTWGAGQ